MWVSSSIWRAVVGITCEGIKIGKRNTEALEEYDESLFSLIYLSLCTYFD